MKSYTAIPENQRKAIIVDLMEQEPETYELYILVAMCKDKDTWRAASKWICVADSAYTNDFEYASHYYIYRTLCAHRSASGEDVFTPFNLNTSILLMRIMAQTGQINLDVDEVETVATSFNEILESVDVNDALAIVATTWKDWISSRKAKRAAQDILRTSGKGSAAKLSKLNDLTRAIEQSDTEEDDLADFDFDIDSTEPIIDRIPLGYNFSRLNEMLGGGLGRTEHIMFIAPTGAGKTVLACQIAADLALNGTKVLLISTEQGHRELIPRFISCTSGDLRIEFKNIKDGDYSSLSPMQRTHATRVSSIIKKNFQFANWTGSKERTVKDDIDALIVKCKARLGAVDVVILDWIGGAIATGVEKDSVRLIYQEAATKMKDVALDHNVATISMAQATADAVDKPRVSEKYLAECKTMHREAVACFGISAMRAKSSGEEATASYTTKQTLFCCKTRKGIGKFFTIERDFDVQCFLNM